MIERIKDIERLKQIAKETRKKVLAVIANAGSGHPGGSLSATDIIVALFYNRLRFRPDDPSYEDRDRFVLSKGHICPVLYVTLAEFGYFPKKELLNLRKLDSMLQGHPDWKKTPGIEISSGSLGQGLSVALGMALASKIDKKDYKIYCLLGDGEMQEGQVWEAAMSAAHFKVDNLVAIVDHNLLQQCGKVKDIMDLAPLGDKFRAFGWDVRTIDGHNFEEILEALDDADKSDRPFVIISRTIKGKGVSFMEHNVDFHGKAPTDEEYTKAVAELSR